MNEDEVKFCSNCKRDIAIANYIMHSMHCQRNLALCPKCDEPIPRLELATHDATLHATIECPECKVKVEKMNLVEHRRSNCKRRAICCTYCDIETEANRLQEHENYCGSRTEKCRECGEFVMLKYQQLHEDSNHTFLKLDDEPGPTASWNKPRATAGLMNDLSRQRKVLNASQAAPVRPVTAPRLSPSKRTNDMPQVNSTSVFSAPKALDKPVIQRVPIEHRDTEPSPYALANSLLDNLALTSADVENLDLVAGGALDYRLGGSEMVALPCEFCDAMIPANQLVLHETGCRPDLACLKNSPPDVTRNQSKPDVTLDSDNGLPCEFCGGLYSPRHLLGHQALCETPQPDEVFVNQLDLPSRRKLMNLPDNRVLHKPIANVNPLSNVHQSASSASVSARRPNSTGAVPKQKAGSRVGLREIQQEVPRSAAAASVTTPRAPR